VKQANLGARIGALLLDSIFINAVCIPAIIVSWVVFLLVLPLGVFMYYGICESIMSASVGKKLCGVSNIHCELKVVNGMIMLTDKNSSSGTFLSDGTRLTPETPYTLTRRGGFYLASRENLFEIE
jgi:hypothetical protein